jgi:hypothetical protein
MLTEELPSAESCWALLERVAASAPLRRSARLKELLFYVGRRSLKDGCDRIQEQEIGSNVFHRPAFYDTSADNIVRTNVSDLRKRLETYFSSEGSHEPLIMEIPRGSYVPIFRPRRTETESVGESVNENQVLSTVLTAETPLPRIHAHWRWMPLALIGSGLLIVLLGATSLHFRNQYLALHRSVFGWQYKPTVSEFWSQLLNANPNTDIVISDAGIGMAQALSNKTFSLDDYLNRSYTSQLATADMSPDMHMAIGRILAWNLASPDEFVLAHRILALDPAGRYLHLFYARNFVSDMVTRDNVILIGARKSNPWSELFENRLNFIREFNNHGVINREPAAGEQAMYVPSNGEGYCVVAYFPNSENTGKVLLIEGTNAEATEAAGNFLLSEDQLVSFKKMLHMSTLPYFQVLLKVSSVRGTPLTATIAAYRVSSGLTKTAGN